MQIVIDHDKVIVEGIIVPRPDRMSPSQWMAWWEYAIWSNDNADLDLREDAP